MDLLNLIEARKSVRKYEDKKIPKEDLDKILRAGWLAPSWMNSQPWKFIAVQNNETKAMLSELAGFQPHVKNADAVIVCVADNNAWNREVFGEVLKKRGMTDDGIDKIFKIETFYPPLLGQKTTLLRSVEQLTYAISYMMLEAKELNIDSCIIGAIANEITLKNTDDKKQIIEKVNNTLNLKDGEVIATMITLGYSENKEEKTNKQRKNIEDIVFYEKC